MTSTRWPWLLVILLTVPLAGCLGQAADPETTGTGATASSAERAAVAEATTTTGALAASVRSTGLDPMAGALVILQPKSAGGANVSGRADADGLFTASGLVPGGFTLQAAAVGHETAVIQVQVTAGEVTRAQVELAPAKAPEPYSVRRDHEGFMAFGWAAMGAAHTMDAGDENHATTFEVALLPTDLETLLVRVAWDDAKTALEIDLWHNVTCSPCQGETTYAHETGNEEIVVRLDRPAGGWSGMAPTGDQLVLFVWPGSTDETPASVAYQLPFRVTFEAFYGSPAPANPSWEPY